MKSVIRIALFMVINASIACVPQKNRPAQYKSGSPSTEVFATPPEEAATQSQRPAMDETPESQPVSTDAAQPSDQTPESTALHSAPTDDGEDLEAQPSPSEVPTEVASMPPPPSTPNPDAHEDVSPRQMARAMALFHEAARTEDARDVRKALDKYLTACQIGYGYACHRYGWHMEKRGNLRNATNFYRVACRRGVMRSCNNLGFVAEQSHRFKEAGEYYDRGCRGNHGISCKNLERIKKIRPNLAH